MPRLALVTALLLLGCGDKDPVDTGACAGLCVDAGFSGGEETDLGDGLWTCVCAGEDGAITQDACAEYCDGHGIPADYAFLSTEAVPDDKCVCDGTLL